MKAFFLFLIPMYIAFAPALFAQVEEEDIAGAREDTVIKIDDRRFIYKGKIYKENSPYLTLGYGLGKNFAQDTLEQNLMISYHHFVKGFGLSLGYHTSKTNKAWWREYQTLVDYYFSVGKRWEGINYNISVFAGPSYATGGYVEFNETIGKNRYYPIRTVGGVAELQLTYRFTYDIGIGLSAYTSMNKYIQVAGAQVHLFFSTAYVRSYD